MPERHHWSRSGIFIIHFRQISHIVLVFLCSAVLFEQVNVGWVVLFSNHEPRIISCYPGLYWLGYYLIGSFILKKSTAWKRSRFGVFLVRLQFECGKIRTKKTPNTDNFHAVIMQAILLNSYYVFDSIPTILLLKCKK